MKRTMFSIANLKSGHRSHLWQAGISRASLIALCSVSGVLSGCSDEHSEQVIIFAASSLSQCLEELETEFETSYPETDLEFVFAGSQVLAMQIEAGARADLFISADFDQIQRVEGFSEAEVLVGNRLVAVHGSMLNSQTINEAVEQATRIIVAHENVPAGRYTRLALGELGIWEDAESKVVSYEHSVRGVLTKIVMGEADLGFVYQTDALNASGTVGMIEFPASVSHETKTWIAQDLDSITEQSSASIAYRFIAESDASREIFARYGFLFWGVGGETP